MQTISDTYGDPYEAILKEEKNVEQTNRRMAEGKSKSIKRKLQLSVAERVTRPLAGEEV